MVKQILTDILLSEKNALKTIKQAKEEVAAINRKTDLDINQMKSDLKVTIRDIISKRIAEAGKPQGMDIEEISDPFEICKVSQDDFTRVCGEVVKLLISPIPEKDR